MLSFFSRLLPQSIKNWYHWFSAVASLIYYRFPARKLIVIGVTGTDGKTTTATLIYQLLKASKCQVALISTVGAYLGKQPLDTGFHVTTPNPWSLQRLIKQIQAQGYRYLVLEATSIGLDQHRLLGCYPTYAVFTNITHEHLDYHRQLANYIHAKAKLASQARVAVLNRDDAHYHQLKTQLPHQCRVLTYSFHQPSQLQKLAQSRFKEVYNQANALAAMTVCQALSLKPKDFKLGLTQFSGVPGRLQTVPNQRQLNLIVDFAHTPNAVYQVLSSLKPRPGKLIAVLGAAGLRDITKRPLMGAHAAALADEVVFTSEDPRGEDPRHIIHQLKSGLKHNHGHAHALTDRQAAINFAINHLAKPGDTVVVLGKGHEASINLDGRHELPWSDFKAIQTTIRKGASS